jgi:PKD repeat protein
MKTVGIFGIFSLLLFLVASYLSRSIHAQAFDWVRQFGFSGQDTLWSVEADESGSNYSVGVITGSLDGQLWNGGQDAFLQKRDAYGNIVWSRQFGTSGADAATELDVVDGYVYLTGTTNGNLDGITAGGFDIFVRKYDSEGNLIFGTQFGTTASNIGYAIRATTNGDVYAGGEYGANAFIAKVKTDGSVEWISVITSSSGYGTPNIPSTRLYGLDIDNSGNILFAGNTTGYLPGQILVGTYDSYVAKSDSEGNFLWFRQFGSVNSDEANDLVVNGDKIYVTGSVDGVLSGQQSQGGQDSYLQVYDTLGNHIFTRQFGTTGFDRGKGIDSDPLGNLYISGPTTGHFPSSQNSGGSDAYLTKFDSNGVLVWAIQTGSTENDVVYGLAVLNDGLIFISGDTWGSFSGYINAGESDSFILKISSFSNQPPSAEAGSNLSGTEGEVLTFDGSNSADPNGVGDIASYDWDFGDGSTGSGIVVSHTYLNEGIYTATLIVTDTQGASSLDSAVVTVSNVAPTIGSIDPMESVLPGVTVNAGAVFSDPGILDTHAAAWDWGDGTVTQGVIIESGGSGNVAGSHSYTTPGVYTVTLTISDGVESASSSVTVTILTPTQATQDLIDIVETFNLQQGIENSLDVKLDAAIGALDDINQNNDSAAINTLTAFINAVEAQRGNNITIEQADILIAAAQQIITYLSTF